jgi:hypothetical protein
MYTWMFASHHPLREGKSIWGEVLSLGIIVMTDIHKCLFMYKWIEEGAEVNSGGGRWR